jgi:3-oxoacyl-[acyl-carrier-protein] synthase-3
MTYARIAGTGGYLPSRVMTNKEFEAIVDTSDEWIRERTGIRRRHIAADDERTSDMALAASRRALKMAEVGEDEVDLISLLWNRVAGEARRVRRRRL